MGLMGQLTILVGKCVGATGEPIWLKCGRGVWSLKPSVV